ncbi:MAG: hypothetical protein ACREMG_12090 [Gemmatimonadales bacterium]
MSCRLRSLLPLALLLPACSTFRNALTPAYPLTADMPAVNQIPDSILRYQIKEGDLIVLATPVDIESEHGFLTPSIQLGAKETWYNVKLVVDSVLKGKVKHAKTVDLGMMPALFVGPPPFGRLQPNEIVVQYPAVNTTRSNWASAPPLVIGERAVFIFRKCYYCLTITGVAHGRGPYYTANPWVAMGWGSKLDPAEWPRVTSLAGGLPSGKSPRTTPRVLP